MYVKGHLLAVCAPVLIAEAVCVFAIQVGCEGVVAGRDSALLDLVVVVRVGDLWSRILSAVAHTPPKS